MEGLRAYAALLIFAVHYFDAYSRLALGIDPNGVRLTSAPSPGTAISYYLFASHYGVDVFFLLSGFLVCRMVGHGGFDYRTFILRRLARIYPAFLVALLIWAWVRIVLQGTYDFDPVQFAGNLLFLNAVPVLGVAPYAAITWSLFFEVLFYLVLPATLLIPPRRRSGAMQVILLGIPAVLAMVALLGEFGLRFAMLFVGALIACVDDGRLRKLAAALPAPLVLLCYAASTLYFAEVLSYGTFIPVFALTGALLVIKVMFGSGPLTRFFASAPLRYLGNMSYSFYLIHGLAIEIVMLPDGPFTVLAPLPMLAATLPLALLIAGLFSTALFLVAEKPYFRWRQGSGRSAATRGLATTWGKVPDQ
jgi:peptidoglycan/LPS O-acetylase OafA/YrhL